MINKKHIGIAILFVLVCFSTVEAMTVQEFLNTHRGCIADMNAPRFKDTAWGRTRRYKPRRDVVLADACAIIHGYQTVLYLKKGAVTCDRLEIDFQAQEYLCRIR